MEGKEVLLAPRGVWKVIHLVELLILKDEQMVMEHLSPFEDLKVPIDLERLFTHLMGYALLSEALPHIETDH